MNNEQKSNKNMEVYYSSVLLNLEGAAKTNRFATKEEYNKYIEGMKKNGMPDSILSAEKKKELLDLYDEYHKTEETKLDIKNYTGGTLNGENVIISKEDDTVLKTESSKEDLPKDFKEKQNELSAAKGQNGLANAKEVYNHLKDNVNEEISLITLSELSEKVERLNISQELLSKISFFVNATKKYINPNILKVSPETGMFYNTETDEVYEVVKNEDTGKYEIVKGGQVIYKEDTENQETQENTYTEEDSNQEKETDEEKMLTEPYVRKRVPPKNYNNQAAFAKAGFLIITSIFIVLAVIAFIVLIKK